MRTATGVILTVVVLASLAYVVRTALPSSPVLTIHWNSQQLFVPFNIAGFWVCAGTGVFLSALQMVHGMLRDAARLR